MTAILDLLQYLTAIVGNLLGIAQATNSRVQKTAQEPTPFEISTATQETLAIVEDGTFGLAAIQAQLATFQATTAIDVTSILTAIAATQQAGSPVTLPVTPPSGYGSPTDQEICDAVWEETPSTLPQPMYELMVLAGQLASPFSTTTDLNGTLGYFTIEAVSFNVNGTNFTANIPAFDPSDILSTEDLLSCLTRQNPTWSLTEPFGVGGPVRLTDTGGGSGAVWDTTIDQAGFAQEKALIFPVSPTGAPVWPGLANVLLGTPVAIATVLTVTEPMEGVLVTITSVPSKQGQFAFGGTVSWRNIGALAFTDDNGDEEFPQTLGFEQAIYCPKSMAQAAGLVLRASAGVTGTVTPWTIA